MEVSKVSQEDGRNCAYVIELISLVVKLVDAFKLAGIPISGPGINNRDTAKLWLGQMAQQMASDMKKQEAEKPMTVKSVGTSSSPLTGGKKASTRKKK